MYLIPLLNSFNHSNQLQQLSDQSKRKQFCQQQSALDKNTAILNTIHQIILHKYQCTLIMFIFTTPLDLYRN